MHSQRFRDVALDGRCFYCNRPHHRNLSHARTFEYVSQFITRFGRKPTLADAIFHIDSDLIAKSPISFRIIERAIERGETPIAQWHCPKRLSPPNRISSKELARKTNILFQVAHWFETFTGAKDRLVLEYFSEAYFLRFGRYPTGEHVTINLSGEV